MKFAMGSLVALLFLHIAIAYLSSEPGNLSHNISHRSDIPMGNENTLYFDTVKSFCHQKSEPLHLLIIHKVLPVHFLLPNPLLLPPL